MGEVCDDIRGFISEDLAHKQRVNDLKKEQLAMCFASFKKFIEEHESSYAMQDWPDVNKVQQNLVVPQYINYGNVISNNVIKGCGIPSIPFLLPMNVNAVLFDMGKQSHKVPNIFQNTILRLLLTMRMDLVKVSIIDMDFGASFRSISSISNPVFKCKIVDNFNDVSLLISDLAKELSNANRGFLGQYSNVEEYNANSKSMAHPYHFVFIDDFPNGFSTQTIEDLLRIIDNRNGCKAGIKVFINYDVNNLAPRDFDIQRFKEICSCVSMSDGENLTISNWPLELMPDSDVELETELAPKIYDYIDLFNQVTKKEEIYSLDNWVDAQIASDSVWSGDVSDGIKVPVGYLSPVKTFDFYMANDRDGSCNDFFALIAGRPGYGKTVLLHNIIVNAAIKYSPDDLCLYLADFAEGASFSIYRNLPHVKSLMLTNNKEYALRMLEKIVDEAKNRSRLYQKAQKLYNKQVTNLSSYREITGEKLPRIVFIMDEFHYLFISHDATACLAKETLCNGIRQWRKFGISVILCTQSINGVSFGDSDTQITYRFALNLLELDSKTVIRNSAAKSLTRKGQTIMNNTADGRVDMNVEFQSAYSTRYVEYVDYLAKLYESKYGKQHRPLICESGVDVDIADNDELINHLVNDDFKVNHMYSDVYVGKPDLLRTSHTRIRYRRQLNSNTLIIGEDYRTLLFVLMVQLVQLHKQSHQNSKFYIADCFNAGDVYEGIFNDISDKLGANYSVGNGFTLSAYIDDIYTELDRRKKLQESGQMVEERVVLSVLNIQNCYGLRPARFMEPSEASKKLSTIIAEGAPLGIHCIIHGLTYETIFKSTEVLNAKLSSSFENQILLKGADIGYMMSVKRVSPIDEDGQMIVINAKIAGEEYEQCCVYSDITTRENNVVIDYMNYIFTKLNNSDED